MADETTTATTQTAEGGATTTPTETPAATTQTPAGTTAPTSTPATDAAKGAEGTTNETGKTDEAKKDAKADAQTSKDAQPNVPEAYNLTAPEGTTLDAAGLELFTPLFKESGLSNEAAQKLVNTYATYQGQLLTKQAETWLATAKADKEIGGAKFDETSKLAQAAFAKWATPELKQFIEVTGLGNHPEMLRAFAKIGKASQEDSTFIKGAGGQGEKSAAEVLYPNDYK